MTVTTTRGDVDDSELRKTVYVQHDDDEQRVTWVEYCEAACDGPAHRTGQPDTEMVWCTKHVHHSVEVTLKRWPHGMEALQGSFG